MKRAVAASRAILLAVALLAMVTLPVGPAAFATLQAPWGLLIPVPSGDVATRSDPTLLRGRLVDINFGLLVPAAGAPRMGDGKGLALRLDLFENASFTAILDEVTQNSPLSYTWVGRLDGVDFSQVILVVEQGIMAGHIAMPGAIYQIRYAGNGRHFVYEIDQAAFPPEARPVEIDASTFDAPAEGGDAAADAGSQIDVLVVYTPAARAAAGGTTGMDTQVDLAIAASNTSYANSGITPRLRLVYKGEVSYTESGNIELDLSRLTNTSDGYMDVVHSLRNTYQADLVALIVENGGGYCGIAWLMTSVSSSFASQAFSVTARGCASANYSFPHELGHNQGARHDWYVDSTNNSPYTYNHGYVNTSALWRTVMAYNTQCDDLGFTCTRLQYWSNPNVSYGGAPMGVPEGQANAAENKKTLDNTAYTVANFRQSGSGPTLALGLNQSSFRSGQTLSLTATVTPGATPRTVDVYVAVSLPDGTLLFYFYPSFTTDIRPAVTTWTVASFSGEIFRYTFTGGEPSGSYTWWAAFTEPGTLTIIGSIASAAFTFSP